MPRMKYWLIALAVLVGSIAPAMVAGAQGITRDEFADTWERTDWPVANAGISRTWMWGPQPFTGVLTEEYAESPGGMRDVQYFDKSRMEITDPNAVNDGLWYVTNGLLVVEMATGEMQVGDNDFVTRWPADVPVAGDSDDIFGPTYETIGWNIEDGFTLNQGDLITGVIDWLGYDPDMSAAVYDSLAAYGITAAQYSPETGKYTASVFWEFMNSSALVYVDGQLVNAPLFENPYYATGLPIDQPWWADVKVGGTQKWVLVQCFERRCLTYTPDNPAGWQVEAGNVGQHYYTWRYESDPVDPTDPTMTEYEYVQAMWWIDDDFLDSVDYAEMLWADYDNWDALDQEDFIIELMFWRELANEINNMVPPARFASVHQDIIAAYDYIVAGSWDLQEGIENGDAALIDQGWDTFDIGWDMLDDAMFDLLQIDPVLTVAEYEEIILLLDDTFIESSAYVDALWEEIDLDDPEWVADLVWELDTWREIADFMNYLVPPASHASLHAQIVDAYGYISLAANLIEEGVINSDVDALTEGWTAYYTGWGLLDQIFGTLSDAR